MSMSLFVCAIVLLACWIVLGISEIFYVLRGKKDSGIAPDFEAIKQIIESLVIEQDQLTVDRLKGLSPTGTLTDEQAKKIFDHVYNEAMEILSEDKSFKKLQKLYGETDVLKVLIEDAVYKHRSLNGKFKTTTLETITADDSQCITPAIRFTTLEEIDENDAE